MVRQILNINLNKFELRSSNLKSKYFSIYNNNFNISNDVLNTKQIKVGILNRNIYVLINLIGIDI